MADVRLAVATRTELGSGNSGRLRKEGKIPAVVYGRGSTPVSVTVDGRELRTALSGEAGLNALLNLDIDGSSHTALATQLQRHPTRGTVTHVDFQIVDRNQAITVDVPVEVVGEAEKVAQGGGQVIADLGTLTVNATPATIPQVIEVDVTNLELGHVIRVMDLVLPDGVTTDTDPETPVVTGLPPRTTSAEGVEDAHEGDEGAEGAPAASGDAADGGDAAAEGDASSEASE
ncbi:MAG: 50S ribosomal protein L25 [Acidimicrobiales bacterium]|nr:50S ribosomal protein L25 [Acidimicrobiales bacterium]